MKRSSLWALQLAVVAIAAVTWLGVAGAQTDAGHPNDMPGAQKMYYIVESEKPFDQAAADLGAAVERHGFGILHIHDLGATLRGKGVSFDEQCKIFEVCNATQAAKVLSTDMRLNMVLPCRISVYTEEGKTRIGMIRPAQMLSALSREQALTEIAEEVEAKTILMIEDAR